MPLTAPRGDGEQAGYRRENEQGERTEVEVWADPGVSRNTHTIKVRSESSDLAMTIENIPSLENPATGRVTNMAEAKEWLKRTYRPNWKLDG